MQTIKYIDLFAGIGGFHYGLSRVDTPRPSQNDSENSASDKDELVGGQKPYTCVYANDNNKYANAVYARHFIQIDKRDITKIDAKEIPDHDLLCAGFPCQAFSLSGSRRGFDDTRGTLFFEIARIVKQKQPRYLLLENVKGLLSHGKGQTFLTILATLAELGYDVQWQVLNSKNFGVPQNRERVIIVGHLRGTPRPEVFPIEQDSAKTTKELTYNVSQSQRIYDPEGLSTTVNALSGGLGAKTGLYAIRGRKNKRGSYDQKLEYSGQRANSLTSVSKDNLVIKKHGVLKQRQHSNAIDANYHKGLDNKGQRTAVANGLTIRRLTPKECERLQGFPDDWTKTGHFEYNPGIDETIAVVEISDTQRYKMLGNAVTTNVVTAVGQILYESYLQTC
jgi:DNA (cytosine-5)-methyltransferase 1